MSLLRDYYLYSDYVLKSSVPPYCDAPLIKKTSRIIFTIVQNDVEGLTLLLDSPKWYRVTDSEGHNLLQIAILNNSKEVFDYLLSLEDFPLSETSKEAQSLLETCLGYPWGLSSKSEHYPLELLKRNLEIPNISKKGYTYLHMAFGHGFIQVAKLLLEKGADVNALDKDGVTPLYWCCKYCEGEDLVEGVTMLLFYGVEPPLYSDINGYNAFETIMKKSGNILPAQEALFYYIFDQYTCAHIHLDVFLKMANDKSPLFYKVLEEMSGLTYGDLDSYNEYEMECIFSMEPQYFHMFIGKCSIKFKMYLLKLSEFPSGIYFHHRTSLDNVDLLVNSETTFHSVATDIICELDFSSQLRELVFKRDCSESITGEVICYFLSYGMILTYRGLKIIYERFRHCELFKIMLHMDVKPSNMWNDGYLRGIIPDLYYNMSIHIPTCVRSGELMFLNQPDEQNLLCYSAHPKVKEFFRSHSYDVKDDVNLPKIPLLVELARNVFRRYFIEKFNITTPRQFYTMLKLLPITEVCKKIISFERKLYNSPIFQF